MAAVPHAHHHETGQSSLLYRHQCSSPSAMSSSQARLTSSLTVGQLRHQSCVDRACRAINRCQRDGELFVALLKSTRTRGALAIFASRYRSPSKKLKGKEDHELLIIEKCEAMHKRKGKDEYASPMAKDQYTEIIASQASQSVEGSSSVDKDEMVARLEATATPRKNWVLSFSTQKLLDIVRPE